MTTDMRALYGGKTFHIHNASLAEVKLFEDRGYFLTDTFPELAEDIRTVLAHAWL